MLLKAFLLMLAGLAILWRRCTDSRLPWTVLWVLACVFLSRVYWLTAYGTLRAEQLACLVLFVHFVTDLIRRRQWPRFDLLPLLLLALLPLMAAGSLLASSFPAASLKKTLIYFPYLAGFIALRYFLDSREKLEAAWDFFIRFGTVMLAVSLAGYFLFLLGVDLGMVRVQTGIIWLRGSFVNPNISGAAAGMVLIAVLARFLTSTPSSDRRSFFGLGALIVSSAVLVVSFSRAVWILAALSAAALFWITRRDRKNWLPAVSAMLASVLITCALTAVGSKAYDARLNPKLKPGTAAEFAGRANDRLQPGNTGEFGEPEKDRFVSLPRDNSIPTSTPFKQRLLYNHSSLRWRLWIAGRALRDWLKSPIIGHGTDYLMLLHPSVPHFYIPVTWVAILHDWGIIALALYVAFLLLAGVRLAKRLYLAPAPSGLALAVFLVLLFHTVQSQVTTTMQLASFWVLAAVFASAAEWLPAGPGKSAGANGRPRGR